MNAAPVSSVEADRGGQTGPLFRGVGMGNRAWTRSMAHHLRCEAKKLPRGKVRISMLRRADFIVACGSTMRTFKCGDCGELAPGMGVLEGPINHETGNAMPCQTRSCPSCSRRRSHKLAGQLGQRLEGVVETKKNGVQFWTFTTKYDPRDEAEVSAQGLRARAGELLHTLSRLWSKLVKPRGATGMFVSLELGLSGAVHAHAIIVGPFLPKRLVESTGRSFSASFGHTWVERVEVKERSSIAREVTKYCVKGPGPKCEGWLAGEKREVMSPELAARWEVAAYRMQLTRAYGLFRGLGSDDVKEDEAEALSFEEEQKAKLLVLECPCCKSVGNWRNVWGVTEVMIQKLHARGLPALAGTRWGKPPPEAPS